MNCQFVKKNLKDYHDGKVSFSDYREINEHLLNCNDCTKKLDAIANKNIKNNRENLSSPHIKKKKWLFSSIIMVILIFVVMTASNGFGGRISFNDQDEFGEAVSISTESSDVKFEITHVAASDEQTVLYFELEDLQSNNHFLTDYQAIEVKEEHIWQSPNHLIVHAIITNREENGVSKGRLFLPPIKNGEETITVYLSEIFHLNSKDVELYSEQWGSEGNRSYVEGDWQVEVPLKKYEAKKFEINEKIDIQGTAVEIAEIIFKPTSTILKINYKHNKSNDHNRKIQLSHVTAFDKEFKIYRTSWDPLYSEGDMVQISAYLDSMYFNLPKEVDIHFGKMIQQVANQVKIDFFDLNSMPFTFDYLGEPITIEKIDIGSPTTVKVKETFDENRNYNTLMLDFDYYRFSSGTMYDVKVNTTGVWLDQEGNHFKDIEQFDYINELRYFTTEHEVEVFPRKGNKPFIPTFLIIEGYTKETELTDHIKVKIKR